MAYIKPYKIRKRPIAEINVVPYIDVMLVLLVIFMIVTPILTQGVNVKLPQAAAKALPPKQETPIIVSVDSRGDYFLNTTDNPTQPISAENLLTQVAATLQLAKQNHQQRDVYVKGDSEVDYGKVVRAMVLLQQAGADSVGLMTQTPENADSKK
jgi:biopolymer transport protein TolR